MSYSVTSLNRGSNQNISLDQTSQGKNFKSKPEQKHYKPMATYFREQQILNNWHLSNTPFIKSKVDTLIRNQLALVEPEQKILEQDQETRDSLETGKEVHTYPRIKLRFSDPKNRLIEGMTPSVITSIEKDEEKDIMEREVIHESGNMRTKACVLVDTNTQQEVLFLTYSSNTNPNNPDEGDYQISSYDVGLFRLQDSIPRKQSSLIVGNMIRKSYNKNCFIPDEIFSIIQNYIKIEQLAAWLSESQDPTLIEKRFSKFIDGYSVGFNLYVTNEGGEQQIPIEFESDLNNESSYEEEEEEEDPESESDTNGQNLRDRLFQNSVQMFSDKSISEGNL